MMINIHLFEYLSFCWFGEISTVSSVSTVYTSRHAAERNTEMNEHTINWIYFISWEWIMCAKFTSVSKIAPNSPMYTHETMKSAFHTKTKILIIFASFDCIFSFVAYHLYISVFLVFLYLRCYILYEIRYQRHHIPISHLDAATMQK